MQSEERPGRGESFTGSVPVVFVGAWNAPLVRSGQAGPTVHGPAVLGKPSAENRREDCLSPAHPGPMRGDMSTKNELIDVIDSARAQGNTVKVIKRQKYDPNNFYFTLVQGGKQVGPVKVEGDTNELNRKFGEAQSYLVGMKNSPANRCVAAA